MVCEITSNMSQPGKMLFTIIFMLCSGALNLVARNSVKTEVELLIFLDKRVIEEVWHF